MTTLEIMKRAKAAAPELAVASTAQKNRALECMAESLLAHTPDILAANAQDVEAARGHISEVMLDRLALTQARVEAMAEGLRQVAALPDPVGRALRQVERPNGLHITRVAVPLGVVAIIYESRPNVTSDAAALSLKSGNACILRGGKEAFRSANAIVEALQAGLAQAEAQKAQMEQQLAQLQSVSASRSARREMSLAFMAMFLSEIPFGDSLTEMA